MNKPVAVILLNWNTPVYTTNCISSLQQYCDTKLFDIIITDNGSTDGSLNLLKARFPELIYINNEENLGFAEGNNRALAYSMNHGYQYSLLINTDTLVDEDIISQLYHHLTTHKHAAAVQPAIYWMHDKNRIWNGEGKFNQLLGITISDTSRPTIANAENYKKAKWVTGCCVLIRNNALQKSGLFNKLFFLYYEDVDLSYRLRQSGYELHYLPSCKMYHEAGVSARKDAPKAEGILSPVIHYYVSRNHLWFLRQYGNKFFIPLNLLYNAGYYAALWFYFKIRRRNQKANLLIKGIKEGLFTSKALIWSPQNLT